MADWAKEEREVTGALLELLVATVVVVGWDTGRRLLMVPEFRLCDLGLKSDWEKKKNYPTQFLLPSFSLVHSFTQKNDSVVWGN